MPAAATAPALPPTAPVTAETRLAYVLRHFGLAYAEVLGHVIGYAGNQLPVMVTPGSADFFSQNQPYPPAPHWREWRGQRVPFFFDAGAQPLLTLAPGRAEISADVVSAAFYLLSGWQEYFSDERDRHGRFPYAASVQARYGFVALPVVNYYFDVLKTAVEHATGQPLRPRPWAPGAPFAAFLSHDLDNLRSAWKAPAKAALRAGQPLAFGRQLWQHWTRPDAWDNLEAVAAAAAQYGARSTFFVLPEHQPGADGTPNADYRLTPRLWQRLGALAKQGHAVALHASIGTADNFARFDTERQDILDAETSGNRFHYLRWEPRLTPALLSQAGISFDSTLGFAEHYGFRNSYCHPFYPFDFQHGQAYPFLEIPLNIMDATLHHPSYLQLGPQEILPALIPMLAEVEKFSGVASVLWHNQNFDPANTANGPRQFHEIMGWLRGHGAAFLTGTEIWARFPAA